MRDPTGLAREGSAAGAMQDGGQWQPELSCRRYDPLAQDRDGPWPAENPMQARRRWAMGPAQRRAGHAHRVVVVGGGFAGLQVVRELRQADAEVTLVDRRNFHLFQPLLYQVATGSLSPGEIAQPLRGILARQRNAKALLADVLAIDLARRRVRFRRQPYGECGDLAYDSPIVAAHSYFGHNAWAPYASGLKTAEDALKIRQRILTGFEAAELETCPERRRAWLTFTVVGAGPTGVELVGQIAEIARAGRITVQPDLTLPGFPEVFAVGDMVRVSNGASAALPKPGTAFAAMQEGRHVARAVRRRLAGCAAKPFAYQDKGSLATIGRKAAVARLHRVRLSGFPAWLAWAIIHLHFLMGGLQNQFIVLVRWTVSFVTRGHSSRLITAAGLPPSPAATQAEPMMVVRRPAGWAGPGGGVDCGGGGRAER